MHSSKELGRILGRLLLPLISLCALRPTFPFPSSSTLPFPFFIPRPPPYYFLFFFFFFFLRVVTLGLLLLRLPPQGARPAPLSPSTVLFLSLFLGQKRDVPFSPASSRFVHKRAQWAVPAGKFDATPWSLTPGRNTWVEGPFPPPIG